MDSGLTIRKSLTCDIEKGHSLNITSSLSSGNLCPQSEHLIVTEIASLHHDADLYLSVTIKWFHFTITKSVGGLSCLSLAHSQSLGTLALCPRGLGTLYFCNFSLMCQHCIVTAPDMTHGPGPGLRDGTLVPHSPVSSPHH